MKIDLRLPFKLVRNDEADRIAKTRTELKEIVESAKSDLKDKLTETDKKISSMNTDLQFWKQQFKKQAPKKKCTKCNELIDVWPFNSTGYYIKGNRVTHDNCLKIKEK